MKPGLMIRTYPLSFTLILLSLAFCVVTVVFNPMAALIEFCVLLVLCGIAILKAQRDFKRIRRTVLALNDGMSAEENSNLNNYPLPVAVFDAADRIVWYNRSFQQQVLPGVQAKNGDIKQFTGGLGIAEIREKPKFDARVGKNEYTVYFSHIEASGKQSYALTYAENTVLKKTARAFEMSRPAVAMIVTDSADEIYRSYKESEFAQITSAVEQITESWFSSYSCIFRKLGSGRFLAVMPESELQKMIAAKFRVMEQVRAYTYNGAKVGITLSIGVGRGEDLPDAENNARQALDMALGRGGDQTVLKSNQEAYRFFGGVSKGVEKRTKVRTRVVASAMEELIRNADIVTSEKTSLATPLMDYVENETGENIFVRPEFAERLISEHTLLIIVDTHKASFVEAPEIYEKAPSVIVIDHHRKTVDYIQNAVIFYHEPHASSTSEMVTELLQYMGKKPIVTTLEANALMAGIMLDTKEFVLRTGVRTFEAAAYLRSRGADTVTVKRFFNSSMENKKLRGQVVLNAQSYRKCAIAVADIHAKDIRIISAQAADELLTVSDVDASFVLFETDTTANISARSMGKINVQLIMEALGGGGHQTMAAVQLADTTLGEAREKLMQAIDEYFENQ